MLLEPGRIRRISRTSHAADRNRAGLILCEFLRQVGRSDYRSISLEKPNWHLVCELSLQHRVAAYLGSYSEQLLRLGLDQSLVFFLRSQYVRQAFLSRVREQELVKVVQSIRDSGLVNPPIVLKGPHLASTVYHVPGARPYGDFDLLLATPQEVEVVRELLHEQGYKQFYESESKSEAEVPWQDKHDWAYVKDLPNGLSVAIDVHWRLHTDSDSYRLSVHEVFARKQRFMLGAVEAACMSAEDTLVYLCTHLFWHGRAIRNITDRDDIRLCRFLDIDLLIRRGAVDWRTMIERLFTQPEFLVPIVYALYGASKYLGTPVPDEIARLFGDASYRSEWNGFADRWRFGTDRSFAECELELLDLIFEEATREFLAVKHLFGHMYGSGT